MTERKSAAKQPVGKIVPGNQYPGVRGKVVDWAEHTFEEGGLLFIRVRFSKVAAQNKVTMKELQQVVVIHRNNCATDKEGYIIKFSGPQLTDPGLERLAKAVRAALRKDI